MAGLRPKTQTEQRVLLQVNKIRAQFHLRPRKTIEKGYRGNGQHCPIANSLGIPRADVWVGVDGIQVLDLLTGRQRYFMATRAVSAFVEQFDNDKPTLRRFNASMR